MGLGEKTVSQYLTAAPARASCTTLSLRVVMVSFPDQVKRARGAKTSRDPMTSSRWREFGG